MKETSYLQLKQYFKNIVEQSEFLEDFVGYFSRELRNKEQSVKGLNFPCLALFEYNIGIEGEDMATSSAVRNISFAILTDAPADEYEKQYEAIDTAEKLALKVASRLRYDSHNTAHFLYKSFLKNTLEIKPIELDISRLFGVEVSFQMKNIQSLKLNADDWKDIDTTCSATIKKPFSKGYSKGFK